MRYLALTRSTRAMYSSSESATSLTSFFNSLALARLVEQGKGGL